MGSRPGILIALDSVGIDPLGHDRPGSVYAESAFLFPRGERGDLLALSEAPWEGALVETDVTGGIEAGAIECAITYASIFSGTNALDRHGLMTGLGLRDEVLEGLIAEQNLFARFRAPCLANAIFPAHLPFLRGSYVEDLLPSFGRAQVEAQVSWEGEPLRLRGGEKRGFAELFTAAEINQNVFVHAARAAGVPLRTWADVRAGRALTGSLTNELENAFAWGALAEATGLGPLPRFEPPDAAGVLARLSAEHDFVFYKYQLADLVSHTGQVALARDTFRVIETFLGALLEALGAAGLEERLVVVTSDHGHLEQVEFTQGHPKSRVPTWVFGDGALDVAGQLRAPAAVYQVFADALA